MTEFFAYKTKITVDVKNLAELYCMPKKARPYLYRYLVYKKRQELFDVQYTFTSFFT